MKHLPLLIVLAIGTAAGSTPSLASERSGRQMAVVDDTVISGAVQRALAADPGFEGYRIYVETYRGAVQLSGWVRSAEQKARAVEIAQRIAGVKSVTNELELDTTRTATR